MIRTGVVFLSALLLWLSAAGAEPADGTRIDQYRGSVGAIESEDTRTANRVMNRFGRCVARNRPRIAEAILALPLDSPEQDALTRQRIGGEDGCLGAAGQLRFRSPLLVGAMAEWFLLDRYLHRDLTDIVGMTDERQTELGLSPRTAYEDIAICVVRRDPASIMALIGTQPSSAEERAAISRLVPSLGPCLPEGHTFNFSHPSLRALLAAGLYRVLTVIGPTALSGTE